MINQYKQFNKINHSMLKNLVKWVDDRQNEDLDKELSDVAFTEVKEFFKSNSQKTGNKKKDLPSKLLDSLDSGWKIKNFKEESLANDKSLNYNFSCKIEKQDKR